MTPSSTFHAGTAQVEIHGDRARASEAGARRAAQWIRDAIRRKGQARILVATGNSQTDLMAVLTTLPDVPWERVVALHLDEYVGLDADHPASFRLWIRTRFERRCPVQEMHYINGSAPDLDRELARYSELLRAVPLDLAFVGFGENGHIAFNDPGVAHFHDPDAIKVVPLDEACIRQQVGEGHFKTMADVPRRALTVTCSLLAQVEAWVCCVPDRRKAAAVRAALEGPIEEACPASMVRRHPKAFVFLDPDSASFLSRHRVPPAIPSR